MDWRAKYYDNVLDPSRFSRLVPSQLVEKRGQSSSADVDANISETIVDAPSTMPNTNVQANGGPASVSASANPAPVVPAVSTPSIFALPGTPMAAAPSQPTEQWDQWCGADIVDVMLSFMFSGDNRALIASNEPLTQVLQNWRFIATCRVYYAVSHPFFKWIYLDDLQLTKILTFDLCYQLNPEGFDLGGIYSPITVNSVPSLLDAANEYIKFLDTFYHWSKSSESRPFLKIISEFIEPLRAIATSIPLHVISEVMHMHIGSLHRSVPIQDHSLQEYIDSWAANHGLLIPANVVKLQSQIQDALVLIILP